MRDPAKLYRWLLRLYPARFREEYATPLERQFLDEYRDSSGGWRRCAFWVRTVRDLLVSTPVELSRELRQDVRYSARIYAKRPVVTLFATIALALAIGATTGVFSVINALLLRSLPFRSPERMVQLGFAYAAADSPAGFAAWRRNSRYLEDAAEFTTTEINLTGPSGTARVKVAETSFNFFEMLGSALEIGRSFTDGEDVPGKNSVAVISNALWLEVFGGDPRALGSTIHLNGTPMTVVGIARPGFDYPGKTAVWTPTIFEWSRLPKTGVIFCTTIGRLKPGITVAQAESIFQASERHRPGAGAANPANRPHLIPLRDQLAGPVRRASLVLFGAVAFLLLIACANVANLLLTRVTERRKELTLRASLGASRARLVQQLITESVLLTCVAAAAGLVVANWTARLASAAQPAQLAIQSYTILDWRVVGFAVVLAAITGLAFGVLPASLIARLQPVDELVRSQPGSSTARVRRMRGILVAAQVSLTLVLLGGAIVMGRSFARLLNTDLGYRTDHVVTLSVSLAGTRHDAPGSIRDYYNAVLARLRAIPGVESAGAIESLPLATESFRGAHFKLDSGREISLVTVIEATPGYFGAMETGILHGRDFRDSDLPGAERVAIVNQEFARQSGLGAALVGRRVTSTWSKEPLTVVGIAQAVRYRGPLGPPMAQLFLAAGQSPPNFLTFVARVRGKTEAYLPICRDAAAGVDRQVPVFSVKTLDERLAEALARPRFYTAVVVFFGGVGLLLAVIGIFGVTSYSVLQRSHELGVRMAVGSSANGIRVLLLRQNLAPVAVGMIVGIAGAAALGQFLHHLLDTAGRVDAMTAAAAAVLLAATAALAAWSATQRVLKMDPMDVLRA